MTGAGTNGSGGRRRLRPLVAVIALYALVLQAVLAGATEPAAAMGIRCLSPADGIGRAPDAASGRDDGTVHLPASCCMGALPELAAAVPTSAVLRPRTAIRLAWAGRAARAARLSASRAANARAPPVV